MTFQDLLAKYRAISFSERDKGDRFERLMQAFLQTVPWYEGKFQHVWLWREFPYKENLGGKDTGIDLVAQTVEGDFWAIQCKCYDEKAKIDKPAVDSFLATSSSSSTINTRRLLLPCASGFLLPTIGAARLKTLSGIRCLQYNA